MKWLPAVWCCLFLWACNGRQCGKADRGAADDADTLMVAEQWQGTVHALTCQDIEVMLSVAHKEGADSGSYQMIQRCKDNNNTFRDEGEWRLQKSKGDYLYVLRNRNGEPPRYYKVKGKQLFELDADKKEVTTYYLEKVE